MKKKLKGHNGTEQSRRCNKKPDYHLLQGLTLLLSNSPLFALTCPSPVVVVNSSCEVADSTLTVNPSNAISLNASGTLGEIIANNIVENLGAATTTGALAQSGAHIVFNNSILKTTATTTANAAGETGMKATGSGSTITATGSSIILGPANGTTAASNLNGARAENGGTLNFNNSEITMLGGAAGLNNIGMIATGLGSKISMQGGIVSTIARASYGAFAQAGGVIKLTDSQISTTGSGTATIAGSHALYAQGNNSQIEGNNLSLSTSGNFTNTVRAADGGLISLKGSIISSAGTSSADTDPASAVRALSGGKIQLQDSTVTATGIRGNGFSVQDAGSSISLNNSDISVSGTRAKAGYIFDGGLATIINSTLHSENTDALVVQGLGSHADLTDSNISSSATLGFGLRINAQATATMKNGSSTTTGRDSPALYATNGNLSAGNVTIQTSGNDNAIGVLADLGGVIKLDGGSVTTTGNAVRLSSFPHGVTARNPGGILTANGTSILTTGYTAIGAVADDGGLVILNGNVIKTQGDKSIGLFSVTEQVGAQFTANIIGNTLDIDTLGINAHGAAAQARNDVAVEKANINLYNSQITTHGAGAVGLRAVLADYGSTPISGRGEAAVVANSSQVSTEGTGAHGALSRDQPTSITMNNTSVLTTGALAHGSVAQAGGRIIGNNTSITTQGNLGSALFLIGTPDAISSGTFTSSTLINKSGPTIGIAGSGDASLTNSRAEGSGQWLFVGTETDFFPLAAIESPQ